MPRLCFVSVLLQEKFSADQTVVELGGLLPATDYSVTLYALYDEEPSDPVTAVATTCKISLFQFSFLFMFCCFFSIHNALTPLPAVPYPPPVSVHFPMVTHSTLRVSWVPGAVDVPGHRITYSTNHGSDVKRVI